MMATGYLSNLYVAIIEDDESLRRALARLLRAAGMQPVAYASAEEFRADVKQPRFACLVVDIQLPGMSGVDLRNRLAADSVATPVLFVTAHDGPRVREEAMAGPCAGYFRKTDAGSEILDAIRRVVSPPALGH
jgi:FixJ family two-component response regulator